MGGLCGFRVPTTRPVCARGAPIGDPPSMAQSPPQDETPAVSRALRVG